MRAFIVLFLVGFPLVASGEKYKDQAEFVDYVAELKIQGATVSQVEKVLATEGFECFERKQSDKSGVDKWCTRQENGFPCVQKQVIGLYIQPSSTIVNKITPVLRDVCL